MDAHTQQPTAETYGDFQFAYTELNCLLFGNRLPEVMFTLARTRHAYGYIIPEGFSPTETGESAGTATIAEIGLNPATFADRTAEQVLSTVAHEMVHLDQYIAHTLGSNGYHNLDFAQRMQAIGLQASDTGKPGGATTGQHMTHYVIDGGAFQAVAADLIGQGWSIRYASPIESLDEKRRKAQRGASKSKYTCPGCGTNVWGKPGLSILCTDFAHYPAQMLPSN